MSAHCPKLGIDQDCILHALVNRISALDFTLQLYEHDLATLDEVREQVAALVQFARELQTVVRHPA